VVEQSTDPERLERRPRAVPVAENESLLHSDEQRWVKKPLQLGNVFDRPLAPGPVGWDEGDRARRET
jgi:hypothetical protein